MKKTVKTLVVILTICFLYACSDSEVDELNIEGQTMEADGDILDPEPLPWKEND